jgi:hypothetical protein
MFLCIKRLRQILFSWYNLLISQQICLNECMICCLSLVKCNQSHVLFYVKTEWIVKGITKIHQRGLLVAQINGSFGFILCQLNLITGASVSVVRSVGGMHTTGQPAGAQLG